MSEARDILGDIVTDRQSFTGDTILNLSTGESFVGEMEAVQDIELNTALGRDPREQVLISVLRQYADLIDCQHRLKVGENIFVALRREDNPENPVVKFGCMKKTSKDE